MFHFYVGKWHDELAHTVAMEGCPSGLPRTPGTYEYSDKSPPDTRICSSNGIRSHVLLLSREHFLRGAIESLPGLVLASSGLTVDWTFWSYVWLPAIPSER